MKTTRACWPRRRGSGAMGSCLAEVRPGGWGKDGDKRRLRGGMNREWHWMSSGVRFWQEQCHSPRQGKRRKGKVRRRGLFWPYDIRGVCGIKIYGSEAQERVWAKDLDLSHEHAGGSWSHSECVTRGQNQKEAKGIPTLTGWGWRKAY